MSSRNDDVAALVVGDLDEGAVAQRHGVSLEQVAEWKSVFLAGMRASTAGRRSLERRGTSRRLLGAAAVLLVALVSKQALAGLCGQVTLPAGLATMCPNSPAVAADLNSNFKQLTDWMVTKTGALGDANIVTTGNISGKVFTGSNINGATVSASGNSSGGSLTSASTVIAQAYTPALANWNTYSGSLFSGAAIINDNGFYKALMIAGNNTLDGTNRVVNLYDNVFVNKNLTVSGNLSAKGGSAVLLDVTACSGGGCCPSGYVQDGKDLNQGAGGDFIFLCRRYAN